MKVHKPFLLLGLLVGSLFLILPMPLHATVNNYVEGNWTSWNLILNQSLSFADVGTAVGFTCAQSLNGNIVSPGSGVGPFCVTPVTPIGVSVDGVFQWENVEGRWYLVMPNGTEIGSGLVGNTAGTIEYSDQMSWASTSSAYGTYVIDPNGPVVYVFKDDRPLTSFSWGNDAIGGHSIVSNNERLGISPDGQYIAVVGPSSGNQSQTWAELFKGVGTPASPPSTTINNYPISQGKGIEGTWNSWVLFDKIAIVPPICGSTCIDAGNIGTSALDVSSINNESLKVFASPASSGGTNVGCYIDYDITYKIVRDVQCLVPLFDRTGLKPYGTSAYGEYIVYPLVCNACGFNVVADYNGTYAEVWHFLYSYVYNFGIAGAGEPTPGQIGIDPTGQWVVILSPDTSNSNATTLWIFKGIGTPASPLADPDPTVGSSPTSCTPALGFVCLTTTSTNTTSTTQTNSTGTCAANQCLPPDVTILGIPVLDLVLGIAIVLLVLVAAYLLGRTKKERGSSLSSAESASRIL